MEKKIFSLEEKYLVHTPIDKYEYKGHEIFVKREDLLAGDNYPCFAKLRGLFTHIDSTGCSVIGALEPTKNTMYGVAVAWVCKLLKKKAIIYYCKYKGDTEIPLNIKRSVELGAEVVSVPAGRTSVVFYQVRKILREKYSDSFMVSNGLKGCRDLIESTSQEVQLMDEKFFNKDVDWVLSCGTGSLTTGIILGIVNRKFFGYPHIYIHLAFTRSEKVLLKRFEKNIRPFKKIERKIKFIDEMYNYGDKCEQPDWLPFPANVDYELKSWKWLLGNIESLQKNIVFYNMGGNLK